MMASFLWVGRSAVLVLWHGRKPGGAEPSPRFRLPLVGVSGGPDLTAGTFAHGLREDDAVLNPDGKMPHAGQPASPRAATSRPPRSSPNGSHARTCSAAYSPLVTRRQLASSSSVPSVPPPFRARAGTDYLS